VRTAGSHVYAENQCSDVLPHSLLTLHLKLLEETRWGGDFVVCRRSSTPRLVPVVVDLLSGKADMESVPLLLPPVQAPLLLDSPCSCGPSPSPRINPAMAAAAPPRSYRTTTTTSSHCSPARTPYERVASAPLASQQGHLFESIKDSLSLYIDQAKVKLKRIRSKFCNTAARAPGEGPLR
jgi:hypothetical protein